MVLADACLSTETTLHAGSRVAATNNTTEVTNGVFLLVGIIVCLLGLTGVIGQSSKRVVLRRD